MKKTPAKSEIRLHTKIELGSPSLAQEQAWSRFWHQLIAAVNATEKEQAPREFSANDILIDDANGDYIQ